MVNREYAQKLWNNLLELGPRRLALLALVGFAVFLGVGGGAYYLSRPEFNALYRSHPRRRHPHRRRAARADVPFDVNAAGDTISVRPSQTAQARMLLAEKGLPTSANAGYELFDKIGSLGLTSFMQEITRVRALEGEIARTIQVMKGVKAARVHIVLPDARLVPARAASRLRPPSSCAPTARSRRARRARSATSSRRPFPGMTPDKVTVLDTDGSMLGSDDDGVGSAPTTMASLQKIVSRAGAGEHPQGADAISRSGQFRGQRRAQLNTDKRQTNETVYDPESRAERSVRAVREKETSQSRIGRRRRRCSRICRTSRSMRPAARIPTRKSTGARTSPISKCRPRRRRP